MIFSRRFSSSHLIDHRGCASARVLQSEDLCLPVARITSLTARSRRDGFLGSLCLVLLTWVAVRILPLLLVRVLLLRLAPEWCFRRIIASDVSKRAEEKGVVRVMKFTLCSTPLVRHAYGFCGFVLAMSPSFDSSFSLRFCRRGICRMFLGCLWLSRVLWFRALFARLILQTSPGRGPFYLSSLSLGILGRWRSIHILGLRFLEPWTFHIGRISVHTHFHHLHTIYGLRSPLRFSVSGGGSQLRTCILKAGHLTWYLLLTIVFRSHKTAMGMNMSFFYRNKKSRAIDCYVF